MCGYGNGITELPSDVKELLGGEEAVEKAASLLNEISGTAGDIDIYDWDSHLLNKKYSFISKNIQK